MLLCSNNSFTTLASFKPSPFDSSNLRQVVPRLFTIVSMPCVLIQELSFVASMPDFL